MSAPTDKRSVHFVGTHPGSDLAIQAERVASDRTLVEEVHRVAGIQDLMGGLFLYETDCGRLFMLAGEARSLSTGLTGAGCILCWAHLPRVSAA